MANKIVELYDIGRITEAMTLEVPIKTAIAALNALYDHSEHQRRFYKDLSPIFGEEYVFTMRDLRISTKVDDPCILYRDIDKTPVVIYYVCLATVVLSVLSKAMQSKLIKHNRYKKIAGKYLRERFMDIIFHEQELRMNTPNAVKPQVSKTLAKNEYQRIHPRADLCEKKKKTANDAKGNRPWVHIIYTPMGNKR